MKAFACACASVRVVLPSGEGGEAEGANVSESVASHFSLSSFFFSFSLFSALLSACRGWRCDCQVLGEQKSARLSSDERISVFPLPSSASSALLGYFSGKLEDQAEKQRLLPGVSGGPLLPAWLKMGVFAVV